MNHDELRKAAADVTVSPDWGYYVCDADGDPIFDTPRDELEATYIALANPQTILALLDENAALGEIAAAANDMALAYAGEMAALSAGVDVSGFPMLDAYQRLMPLLMDYQERGSV